MSRHKQSRPCSKELNDATLERVEYDYSLMMERTNLLLDELNKEWCQHILDELKAIWR